MSYRCITSLDELAAYLKDATIVAFDFETSPMEQYRAEERAALDAHKSQIAGISLSVSEGIAVYVPLTHRTGKNADAPQDILQYLRHSLFESPHIVKVAHNLAFEAMFLYAQGIVVQPPCYDTMAAAQLTLKNKEEFRGLSDSGLKLLATSLFQADMPDFQTVTKETDTGCPIFKAFLRSVLDEPEIHLLQEIFGYLLIPVNKAQKSFVFVGAPNAGKSTLLAVAQEILLGSENVSNIPWQGLSDRFNKAELFGKLANIFADLPSKAIDDNGMFKALTGEDYITAERKNKDPFSFRPYARFLFSCNDIPRNYGDRSDGFFRRLIIIRFNRSVPSHKRDAGLREKLAVESDGIFMWALEGLSRLMSNGYCFTETASTKAELERYKTESSSSLSFADSYLAAENDATVFRDDVYEAYKNFCSNSGFKNLSQIMFNRDIEAHYPVIKRGQDRISKRRTWIGLRFCQEGRDTE